MQENLFKHKNNKLGNWDLTKFKDVWQKKSRTVLTWKKSQFILRSFLFKIERETFLQNMKGWKDASRTLFRVGKEKAKSVNTSSAASTALMLAAVPPAAHKLGEWFEWPREEMRGRVRHARRGRSTNTMMSWEVASSQHLVSFFMPTAERAAPRCAD